MGAGSRKDHYIQDAAEAYIVYRLQDLAVKNNTALTNSAEDKKKLFDIYCYDRDITSDFEKSIYKDNIDAIVDGFYSDLVILLMLRKSLEIRSGRVILSYNLRMKVMYHSL